MSVDGLALALEWHNGTIEYKDILSQIRVTFPLLLNIIRITQCHNTRYMSTIPYTYIFLGGVVFVRQYSTWRI